MAKAAAILASAPAKSTPDAATLLEDFRVNGSQQAFEQIVRAYAGMVYTVCLGVTKNAHDAEDSAQATFLSLATQVKLGKSIQFIGPWLRQVAKRTALDHRKSRQRREKREATHGREAAERVHTHEGESLLDAETYRKALHEELDKLPDRYRAPLKLHYLGGLSSEEAALELDCKPQTLAVRLHRGRKMLATRLSRRGLFLSAEMLGLSSMPAIPAALKTSAIHASTHAATASHLLAAHDVVATIVAPVMHVIRSSASVMLFSKMKVALILAVLITAPLVANGARIARIVSNISMQLPTVSFDVSQWIRPLLKSFTSKSSAVVASAMPKSKASTVSGANSIETVAFNRAGYSSNLSPRLSLTSLDTASDDFSIAPTFDSRIMLASADAGTFENAHWRTIDRRNGESFASTPFAPSTAPTSRGLLALNSVPGGSSVTPEPASATFLSLSVLALKRRRKASH